MQQYNLEEQFENLQLSDVQNEQELVKPLKKLIRFDKLLLEQCLICLTQKNVDNNFCLLDPCNHTGCVKCISYQIEFYNSKCPFCRNQIQQIWPIQIFNENKIKGQFPINIFNKQHEWNIDDDSFYNESNLQTESENESQLQLESQTYYCMICNQSNNTEVLLICDGCDQQYCHTYCDYTLPNSQVPLENWYCFQCRIDEVTYYQQQ